jgi:hypothetical protein
MHFNSKTEFVMYEFLTPYTLTGFWMHDLHLRRRWPLHLGSMLWSQISEIFANFMRKNWRFSPKTMLWSIFCTI